MITEKAPTRIDLGGGTLDLFPLYLFYPSVKVTNLSIDLYATTIIKESEDLKLSSVDQKTSVSYSSSHMPDNLLFHKLIVENFNLEDHSMEIITKSSVPVGSGLGGSSALIISMIKAVSRYLNLELSKDEILTKAQHIETKLLQVPTGTQDYIGALNTGINLIDYSLNGIQDDDFVFENDFVEKLENHLILFYSGKSHHSADENWQIFKQMIDQNNKIHYIFSGIQENAKLLYQAFIEENMEAIIKFASQDWKLRKQLLPSMETEEMSKITRKLEENDQILGIKGLGAGAGGCMLVFVKPELKKMVTEFIISSGFQILDFKIVR